MAVKAHVKMVDASLRSTRNPRAEAVLPGGYGRSSYDVGPSCPQALRGIGYLLFDHSGEPRIDTNNNFTSLIHGHAHPHVVAEATRAIADGASFGQPCIAELELAETLVDRVPCADQVRFTNSGTEAVMTSLRMARAITGREKIIVGRPSYHGTADAVIGSVDPNHLRGVTRGVAQDILWLQPGDADGLRELVAEHADSLAAVILDLMPTRAGLRPLDQEFVALARTLTSDVGAMLIVDEIIAYRAAVGGLSASRYGLVPDLMTVGKIIGGGLPIGAVLGSREAMDVLNPRNPEGIDHGGTFSGNPVSMSAGLAAMRHFDAVAVDRLNAMGDALRASLRPALAQHGWDLTGAFSLLRIFPTEDRTYEGWQDDLWWSAYDHGLLILPKTTSLCLSTAMDDAVVKEISERLITAVANIQGPGH